MIYWLNTIAIILIVINNHFAWRNAKNIMERLEVQGQRLNAQSQRLDLQDQRIKKLDDQNRGEF